MPNAFLSIETNFPTFNADQKTEDKIDSMVNYLFILVEQLRYTLNNLDTKNFNATALSNFAADTTEEVTQGLTVLAAQLNQTNQSMAGLSRRVGSLEALPARVEDLEDTMEDAQGDITQVQNNVIGLQSSVSGQDQRLATLELWRNGPNNDGAEADIADLRQRYTDLSASVTALQTSVATLVQEMTALNGVISIDQNNNVEIGNFNKITNLKGIVQVNGGPITS